MFANFKSKLLKVDLRKGGKKIIVLETSARLSAGELDALNEMIDQEVLSSFDSQVISYKIQKNSKTDMPVISYTVSDAGIVEELKQKPGEQLQLDMGLPPEKASIKEEIAEIPRSVVEDFVAAGLAPRFVDLEFDLPEIIWRHADGESYSRLAAEFDLSTGKLAELLEDYYKRIAPLAAKWDEWRQRQGKPAGSAPPEEKQEGEEGLSEQPHETDIDPQSGEETVVAEPENETENLKSEADEELTWQEQPEGNDELSDWEREILSETGEAEGATQENDGLAAARTSEQDRSKNEITPDELDAYILSQQPHVEGIEFNFPALLVRKKAGETWMNIAKSEGTSSSKISVAWAKYKEEVRKMMIDGVA